MSEPLIGTVVLFAGNFAPVGWALCNGQLLQITSNSALFSVIGTTYGGDGKTTFGLPDLRGRVPMGAGRGADLTERRLGEVLGGERDVTPGVLAAGSKVALAGEGGAYVTTVETKGGGKSGGSPTPVREVLTVEVDAGGTEAGGPSTLQPSLAMNYIICVAGTFPSRG